MTFDDVATDTLFPGTLLPLVLRPKRPGVDAVGWAREHWPALVPLVNRHGAVLFRGFDLPDGQSFHALMEATCGAPQFYREGTSPRVRIVNEVYTSTEYPAEEMIYFHNEQSFAINVPRYVAFHCLLPSPVGGETPLVDTRGVYGRIPADIRERLMERRYRYVRNYHRGVGLSWETTLHTQSREEVEGYLRGLAVEWEWRGDALRTWQIRDVAVRHPDTGEPSWVNHAAFYHVSTLPDHLQDLVFEMFPEDADLPANTYYGDGEPFEIEMLDTIRAAYETDVVAFPWEKGDAIIVDNYLVAHARRPFQGPRRLLTGLTDVRPWSEIRLRG